MREIRNSQRLFAGKRSLKDTAILPVVSIRSSRQAIVTVELEKVGTGWQYIYVYVCVRV